MYRSDSEPYDHRDATVVVIPPTENWENYGQDKKEKDRREDRKEKDRKEKDRKEKEKAKKKEKGGTRQRGVPAANSRA